MITDYLTRTRDARPRPVPQPWYAARCRTCGWTSPPASSPEPTPDRCPSCEDDRLTCDRCGRDMHPYDWCTRCDTDINEMENQKHADELRREGKA